MDDPNNPSIPASNSFPTPEPAVPEMPMPGPMTTTTTTTQPLSIAEQPFGGTTSTTTSTPTSTTTSTTTETLPPTPPTTVTPEVQWPGSKPKSKLPQILGGIAAIILVVGVATAAYFVSNKISGRQAVAPNAPESKPFAKKKEEEEEVKKKWEKPATDEKGRPREVEDGKYTVVKECSESSCPGPCFSCAKNGSCQAHSDVPGCEKVTKDGKPTVVPTATPKPPLNCKGDSCCECRLDASYTTCVGNGSCPPDGSLTKYPTKPPTPTGTKKTGTCVGSPGATSCSGGVKTICSCSDRYLTNCNWADSPVQDCLGTTPTPVGGNKACEATCEAAPNGYLCLLCSNKITPTPPTGGNCGAGQTCEQAACGVGKTATGSCKTSHGETGVCCKVDGVTPEPPIGGPIVTPKPTKKPGEPPEEPPVASCTEQCPGSDGILRSCTPPEADGSSYDSLCNEAGRVESCGNKPYCCPSAGGDWTTNMAACTATCVPSTWTPALDTVCIGTSTTQTSDCKTTRVVGGTMVCTNPEVPGACMEVALYGKICQPAVPGGVTCMAEGYQTTPMTAAQRANLRVGYKIRIGITGSKADLKARFRVFIDDVVETPEWKLGQEYPRDDKKTRWYSDYEIKKSGNYKFEGQVTTEPSTVSTAGQFCGGIAGVMCPTGYDCVYPTRSGAGDESGTCQIRATK